MSQDPDNNPLEGLHLDTLAVRAGIERTAEGEHAEPIFATSSYVFANAAEAADRFAGEESGNVYSRYTNPTVRTFEQRIAALEGAQAAVATASGMAAIHGVTMLLSAGDHVLAGTDGHITGAELVERCREQDPEVTPSTVYRTLDVLEDIGLIRHAHGLDGREEFHVRPAREHGHIHCSVCHRAWEIGAEEVADLGADLVGEITTLESSADIIRAHHERWDGSGYPEGISGDRILYEPKVVLWRDKTE